VLHCLQLLRDGSLVCCGAGNFALFVMTPQQSGGWKTEEIGEHPDGARTICALPDGSFVSAGQGDRILVWSRSETGEWRAQTIHSKGVFYVREIQPTSGGRFVSLGGDGKVRVWRQAASGTWEAEANQPLSAGAMCLKQLPGGGLVLGTADGAVEIWREEDGSGWTRESLRHEDPSAVSAIHVHQDGSIISAQVDGTVIRWHRREGLGWEAERMSDGKDAITRYVSLPDGTLVSTYVYSRSVLVWQLNLDEEGIVC